MVLGDTLKLEAFVWILNHISRFIAWSLFTLKASCFVIWPISTWSFICWCEVVKFIWNNSYLYCGCRWKWRVIIAVNFSNINFTTSHCMGRYELNKFTSLPMWGFIYVGLYRRGHGFKSRWIPDFFQASSFQLLKLEKFTVMITLHFHLQPQYKYELYYII